MILVYVHEVDPPHSAKGGDGLKVSFDDQVSRERDHRAVLTKLSRYTDQTLTLHMIEWHTSCV